MREKMIEQRLKNGAESICDKCIHGKVCRAIDNQPCIECNQFADANGVTVQEWISVKDRLPDENGYYLCEVCFSSVSDCKSYRRLILYWEDNVWIDMPNCFKTRKPTHWMPLPQPPKGE